MKNKILIILVILMLIPTFSYADYIIDTSNSIIEVKDEKLNGYINGTFTSAIFTPINCIDEEIIRATLDEVNFNFKGTFTVNIVDYSTYLQDVIGLALPDNQIILFDFIPFKLDMIMQTTVVHELGHLVYMQLDEEQQNEYKILRGIPDDWDNYPRTSYINRPQEIFAEDFRMLFGGESASPYVHHNQELDNPSEVKGLKRFIRRFESKEVIE